MFQSKDYIYEIYRCGSFSAAARNLYITQPAISIAVKKEEQELGQPIFERSSSRLLLTDAGRAYIDAVEKLHRIEDDLKVYCNDLSNLKTGALRIGASSFFLSSIVLPVVAEYSRRYPGISLDVQEAPSLELQKRLANEALDILVDPVDQQGDTFDSVILFEDHFLLAVPSAPNFFASMGIKKDLLPAAFTADEIRRGVHLDPAAPSVSLSSFAKAPFLLLRPVNHSIHLFRTDNRFYTSKIRCHYPQFSVFLQDFFQPVCQPLISTPFPVICRLQLCKLI